MKQAGQANCSDIRRSDSIDVQREKPNLQEFDTAKFVLQGWERSAVSLNHKCSDDSVQERASSRIPVGQIDGFDVLRDCATCGRADRSLSLSYSIYPSTSYAEIAVAFACAYRKGVPRTRVVARLKYR